MGSRIINFYPHFTLILQKTYKEQGFFNVKREDDHFFGEHNTVLEIYTGENEIPIRGKINREAQDNGTYRIMGGIELKNWFRSLNYFEKIQISIISNHSIKMEVKQFEEVKCNTA